MQSTNTLDSFRDKPGVDVVYLANHHSPNYSCSGLDEERAEIPSTAEEGVVAYTNDRYVFVTFYSCLGTPATHPIACEPGDLWFKL